MRDRFAARSDFRLLCCYILSYFY